MMGLSEDDESNYILINHIFVYCYPLLLKTQIEDKKSVLSNPSYLGPPTSAPSLHLSYTHLWVRNQRDLIRISKLKVLER